MLCKIINYDITILLLILLSTLQKGDEIMKRIIAICLLIYSILFSFTSCTTYENITFIENNNEKCLLYQENIYFEASIFDATEYYGTPNENDIELGWYYSFPFGTRFYSNKSESPLFIYTIGGYDGFFLRQDYNYSTDIFVIENTTKEIVWKNIFASEQDYFYFSNPIEVVMYSKQCPRIKTCLDLVCVDGQWYISLADFQGVFTISDEFIKALSENGIINP